MTFAGAVHPTREIDLTSSGAGQECPKVPYGSLRCEENRSPLDISETVRPRAKMTRYGDNPCGSM
jgi:hypothetical protein